MRTDRGSALLFDSQGLMGDWLAIQSASVQSAIDAIPPDRLLREPLSELAAEIVDRHRLVEPQLTGDRRTPQGAEEVQVDVRHDQTRLVMDRSRPAYVPGQRIEVRERFEGDPAVFSYQPSQFTFNPPRGIVVGDEVAVVVELPSDSLDPERLKGMVDGTFSTIEKYLAWAASDVRGFNNGLAAQVRSGLQARLTRVQQGRNIESILGIPIGRRQDASPTLAIDVPRRMLGGTQPAAARPPSSRVEPFITDDSYQDIVRFLGSIRRLIERLPETFSPLPEEALRDILLLILNNQFGSATGESFSRKGKTDILIATPDGPVFITECKIWNGKAAFTRAVSQLLGYLVWRDTKAALVVFVRQANITSVTQQAVTALQQHGAFVREAPAIDGDPVVVLHHPGDYQRLVRVGLVIVPLPPTVSE
jgi:hypothetical protein